MLVANYRPFVVFIIIGEKENIVTIRVIILRRDTYATMIVVTLPVATYKLT